jgi:hypothetical protein
MQDNSVPGDPRGAVVSCHLERPLDDAAWARFDALRRRFDILALIRPPDAAHGEDDGRWLERARTLPLLGLHTHWTSPTHARPSGDADPADRVRSECAWMRERGLEPRWFCGGGWYTDDGVRAAVQQLGLVDCTPRDGLPRDGVLPTTHSLGQLARSVLWRLPPYVHAYFHDYDLSDVRRRLALTSSLQVLRMRRAAYDASSPIRKSHGTR